MKNKGFALIPVLIILSLITVVGFILWSNKTNYKLATGLNGRVTVRLDSGSTVSENQGVFVVSLPEKKRIEISELENKFPQAKTAKEYNELDRKNYEDNLSDSLLPQTPGFTDDFIQEINTDGSNWESAIEVKAFHLASSEGLRVRKFIVLKNGRVYEVYFIFPPDSTYYDSVIQALRKDILFN